MDERARIIIDFYGDNGREEALGIVDAIRQLCMRRDPTEEPFAHIEIKKSQGVWTTLQE